jgi:hypothetical protein
MQEQLDNWGKMAAFMHMTGRVPAAYADQPGKASIARYRRRKVAVYSGIWISEKCMDQRTKDLRQRVGYESIQE